MTEYTESDIKRLFIGKYIVDTFDFDENPRRVLITDIKFTTGNPEHFPPYYSVYSTDKNGKKYFVISLPEKDFHNEFWFSDTPDIRTLK